MYTITVKISARGTIYHEDGTSATGHMWYSLSNGSSTESYGFAPAKDSMPVWEGTIKRDVDSNYGSTYYTGTIVIDYNQYAKLQQFGITANLSKYQNGEMGTGYFMIKSFIFKNRRGDAADATRG